jgi:hypothetical protein
MDFFSLLSLVTTLILSLLAVVLLSRPFFLEKETLDSGNADVSGMNADERALKKEMLLESLEELELARKNGILNEEQFNEQKELIMQDASTLLEG